MAIKCRIGGGSVLGDDGKMHESKLYDQLSEMLVDKQVDVNGVSMKYADFVYRRVISGEFKTRYPDLGIVINDGEPTLKSVNEVFFDIEYDQQKVQSYLNTKLQDAYLNASEGFDKSEVGKMNACILFNESNSFGLSGKYVAKPFVNGVRIVHDNNGTLYNKKLKRVRDVLKNISLAFSSAGVDPFVIQMNIAKITGDWTIMDDGDNLLIETISKGLRKFCEIAKSKKRGSSFITQDITDLIFTLASNNGNFVVDPEKHTTLASRLLKYYQRKNPRMSNSELNYLAKRNISNALSNTSKISYDSTIMEKVVNAMFNYTSNVDESKLLPVNEAGESEISKLNVINSNKTKSLLDEIKKIIIKRQNLYENRLGNNSDDADYQVIEQQRKLIRLFDVANEIGFEKLRRKKDIQGTLEQYKAFLLMESVDTALSDLERIRKDLIDLYNMEDNDILLNQKCKKLNIINDYIESYRLFCNLMNKSAVEEALVELGLEGDELNDTLEQISERVNAVRGIVEALKPDYINSNNTDYFKKNERDTITYWHVMLPTQLSVLQEVCPEGAILRLNGEIVDLKSLLHYYNGDVKQLQLWVHSVANTNDDLMKMYDQVIKKSKHDRDSEIIEIREKIIAAARKLKNTGWSRRHEFMYEHDTDGSLVTEYTGRPKYISHIVWDNYWKALNKYRDMVNNDPDMETDTDENGVTIYLDKEEAQQKRDRYIKEWIDNNTEVKYGRRFPRVDEYGSDAYKKLSDEEREFYDVFMDAKYKMDRHLGLSSNDSLSAIMVEKTGIQTLMSSRGTTEWFKDIWAWMGRKFTPNDNDLEFGDSYTIKDFSGRDLRFIPIRYSSRNFDNALSSYSMDCVTNLLMYSRMALSHKYLGRTANVLENARAIMSNRKKLVGNKMIVQKATGSVANEEIINEGISSQMSSRFDDMLDMQIYENYRKNKTKGQVFSDIGMGFVSSIQLAANFFAQLTNVVQGLTQTLIESAARENFNPKNVATGISIYVANMPSMIVDAFANKVPRSKMLMMIEQFDMLQDSKALTDIKYHNRMGNLTMLLSPYLLQHLGEHFLQTISALSIMDKKKIYMHTGKFDKDGNEILKPISLYSAYERYDNNGSPSLRLKAYKYTDSNGNQVKSSEYVYMREYDTYDEYGDVKEYRTGDGVQKVYSGRQTKRGVEKKVIVSKDELRRRIADQENPIIKDINDSRLLNDGEISELNLQYRYKRNIAAVNQQMHGIYNEEDMNKLSMYALGRWVLMYRKYMAPSFYKRFSNEQYNYDLQSDVMGMSRKSVDVAVSNIKSITMDAIKQSIREHKFSIVNKKYVRNVSANTRRVTAQLLLLYLNQQLIEMLEYRGYDDDEDDYFNQLMLLLAYRNRAETAMLAPEAFVVTSTISLINLISCGLFDSEKGLVSGYPVEILTSWLAILDSPIAGVTTVSSATSAISAMADYSSFKRRSSKNDYTNMSARSFSKLPKDAKIKIYYYLNNEDYSFIKKNVDEYLDLISEDDLKRTGDMYNELSKEERQSILNSIENGPTYARDAFKGVVPVLSPLKKSKHPENQLNYYQREFLSDRLRQTRMYSSFTMFNEDEQATLKNLGYNKNNWNDLTTPQRIEIGSMVSGGIKDIPPYEESVGSE